MDRVIYSFMFVLILLSSKSVVTTKAQPPIYLADDCDFNPQKPLGGEYQTNLNSILSWLSSDAATSKGYNHKSIGKNNSAVYGLYDCRGDVVGYFCQFCVSTASRQMLQRCPNRVSAIMYYNFCILRYSNENFFGNVTIYPPRHVVGTKNVSSEEEIQKGEHFMRSLIRKATVETDQLYYMDGFNLSSTQKRYGLVQCSRDLTNEGCRQCLEAMLAQVPKCCEHKLGWLVGTASCHIKYDDYMFYLFNNQSYLVHRITDGLLPDTVPLSAYTNLPTIQLITILETTNNFSEASKLGEGGFGPVYKGILPDGRQVAVKRLSRASNQGSEEFKNEVTFIAKLQHCNLVRLLACCLDENEKILVYEYLSNASLDFHLFDDEKRKQLDWKLRLSMINGIARGLLYLHEGSRLKWLHGS
ncbi:hypothetical protein GLYMA_15G226500v4 [Glycine max]|nr:hypothetical protein GLYMA_15G226500v4 [Glycine max]